ncbi:MAG: HNH endonuclease [Actinomycetia bacterium]|nr:HNH endonuclease [Actinomycetes bacterium]
MTFSLRSKGDDSIGVVWPGEGAFLYEWCRDQGYITIGWFQGQDMSAWDLEALDARFRATSRLGTPRPEKNGESWTTEAQDFGIRQVADFLFQMDPPRTVLTCSASGPDAEVLLGEVVGPYEYHPDLLPGSGPAGTDPYHHFRRVEWRARMPRKALRSAAHLFEGRHWTVWWIDPGEQLDDIFSVAEEYPFVGRKAGWDLPLPMEESRRKQLFDLLRSERPSNQVAAAQALAAEGDQLGLTALRDALSYIENERAARTVRKAIASLEERLRRGVDSTGGSGQAISGERMTRGRDWTREELLLALDLYLQHGGVPREASDEVGALSELLRDARPDQAANPAFRSVHAVWLQLREFEYLATDGRQGFLAAADVDKEVFSEFAPNSEAVQALAREIRADIPTRSAASTAELPVEFAEGRVVLRLHASRERNQEAVRRKKADARKKNGRLACEACDFDFGQRYDIAGSEEFIECHHDVPISTYMPGQVTSISDLRLVCANCHRMLHLRRPWLSVEQLRGLLMG